MLEVIVILNDIEIMVVLIDEETQVDMVFETLSNSFDTFKLDYSINKLSYNLTELMKGSKLLRPCYLKGRTREVRPIYL